MIIPHIDTTAVIEVGVIAFIYILTWVRALKSGFVSDDHDGIERFSESVKDGVKVSTYNENGKDWRFGQFNNSIPFPYSIIRWFRINVGRKFQVIGQNSKGHDIFGYIQDPFRHHLLNLVLHLINTLLTYSFLTLMFGHKLAFIATLLFITNPVSAMSVAWVSGFGYLLSYFGLISLCIVSFLSQAVSSQLAVIVPVSFLHFLSLSGMFAASPTPIIMFLMNRVYLVAPLIVISAYFMWNTGRKAVLERKKHFTEQNMGNTVDFRFKKLIVAIKTFYYYVCMIIFPMKLGLFHTWGYTYDERMEHTDGMFLRGLTIFSLFLSSLFVAPFAVKFGIIWFMLYLITFLNFVTAQQFVVDRYLFIPSLGFSIVCAYFLQNYMPVFYVILGLYIMRTWVHIPTFDNEIKFYQSNVWNFWDSEVAWGNLGVAYAQRGWQGSAFDCWMQSTKVNDFYSVPHYNLYNVYKIGGALELAKKELEKCLNSKVVQFPEMWQKELTELNMVIEAQKNANLVHNPSQGLQRPEAQGSNPINP